MQNNSQLHSVFQGILNALDPNAGNDETFQTDKGPQTGSEIIRALSYSCYEYNRDVEGMSHKQLVSIGLGNDEFKTFYEKYKE